MDALLSLRRWLDCRDSDEVTHARLGEFLWEVYRTVPDHFDLPFVKSLEQFCRRLQAHQPSSVSSVLAQFAFYPGTDDQASLDRFVWKLLAQILVMGSERMHALLIHYGARAVRLGYPLQREYKPMLALIEMVEAMRELRGREDVDWVGFHDAHSHVLWGVEQVPAWLLGWFMHHYCDMVTEMKADVLHHLEKARGPGMTLAERKHLVGLLRFQTLDHADMYEAFEQAFEYVDEAIDRYGLKTDHMLNEVMLTEWGLTQWAVGHFSARGVIHPLESSRENKPRVSEYPYKLIQHRMCLSRPMDEVFFQLIRRTYDRLKTTRERRGLLFLVRGWTDGLKARDDVPQESEALIEELRLWARERMREHMGVMSPDGMSRLWGLLYGLDRNDIHVVRYALRGLHRILSQRSSAAHGFILNRMTADFFQSFGAVDKNSPELWRAVGHLLSIPMELCPLSLETFHKVLFVARQHANPSVAMAVRQFYTQFEVQSLPRSMMTAWSVMAQHMFDLDVYTTLERAYARRVQRDEEGARQVLETLREDWSSLPKIGPIRCIHSRLDREAMLAAFEAEVGPLERVYWMNLSVPIIHGIRRETGEDVLLSMGFSQLDGLGYEVMMVLPRGSVPRSMSSSSDASLPHYEPFFESWPLMAFEYCRRDAFTRWNERIETQLDEAQVLPCPGLTEVMPGGITLEGLLYVPSDWSWETPHGEEPVRYVMGMGRALLPFRRAQVTREQIQAHLPHYPSFLKAMPDVASEPEYYNENAPRFQIRPEAWEAYRDERVTDDDGHRAKVLITENVLATGLVAYARRVPVWRERGEVFTGWLFAGPQDPLWRWHGYQYYIMTLHDAMRLSPEMKSLLLMGEMDEATWKYEGHETWLKVQDTPEKPVSSMS